MAVDTAVKTILIGGFFNQTNLSAMHGEARGHWSSGGGLHLLLCRQPVQHCWRCSLATAGYPGTCDRLYLTQS